MTDYGKMTKEELIAKAREQKKVLDRRPEARFARWIENGAFLAGVIVMLLSVFNFPWLDMSALELTLVVAILVVPKVFGKAVGVDMLKSGMSSVGDLARAVGRKNKNG